MTPLQAFWLAAANSITINYCSMDNYSVIIRTLKGGPKYQRLLNSLVSQSILPENIYVALPYGYEPPKETCGRETFIYCDKGMWSQRIYGMEYVYNLPDAPKYLLVCDDDLEFDRDFLEKIIAFTREYDADIMAPIKNVHRPFKRRLFDRITGGRIESSSSKFKITILSNGSYAVNNKLSNRVNPTQSAPFALFLMRTNIVPQLNLRDEMWLDECRYAWPDDQVFHYKAFLAGLKTFACDGPYFTHLDGKAGVTTDERKADAAYISGRNRYIFWRKFLYNNETNSINRLKKRMAFWHKSQMSRLYYFVVGCKKHSFKFLRSYNKGLKSARKMYKVSRDK